MLPEYFVFISVFLSFCSSGSYVYATLRGKTRPNRITWFIWALAPFIATAAQLAKGVGLSTLVVFMAGFGPLVIFISSFINKKAYWHTTLLDWICGLLALLGLIGWWFTKDGDIAIVFSIAADFCAAIPTLRKAWFHPKSENGITFLLGMLGNMIGFLCVRQKSFTGYAFTVYMIILCAALSAIIYGRKNFLSPVNESTKT